MKFDQDLCATCGMNSTLGSVVPLAMFVLNIEAGGRFQGRQHRSL